MVKPIPKNLLIHTVTHEPYEEGGGWDEPESSEPVTIERVLVQPASALRRNSNADRIEAENVLFVDRANSSAFPDIKAKDTVKFDGKSHEVHKVNKQYAFGPKPHHIEVELV
ncbi:minor capsid protein [Salsuginibacillus halophilus]|uniref:Minor capsid protein n=1 Tax=Salsuginibacillus halophilus TaxID=517424 RepID=A0A2P8H654_9BACI|nr:putative minor capsid protein [Salsuginibacillus halophilus]PSL41707.1 minor capsid protein [Salsuginibacillus halophilus]